MVRRHTILGTALLGSAVLFAHSSDCNNPVVPVENHIRHYQVPAQAVSARGIGIQLGGYGSDLAYNPADSTFWLLTDRGPNVDGNLPQSKIFPLPDFNPHIGVFKIKHGSLSLVKTIPLLDSSGEKFTGLPPARGNGRTDEISLDVSMHKLPASRPGIDPEGLAIAADGSFWVSDEYAPSLMHFSAQGQLMQTRTPQNGLLPARYARRRPNRGLEGLCLDPATGTIYGILQSPLTDSDTRTLPLFAIRPDGSGGDYDYPLSEQAQGVSALCVLNDSTLLVLERDGRFPVDGKGFKRIFKTVIPRDRDNGRLHKQLLVDLLEVAPGYDHDKVEGMALIGDSILAIANDDDFGITTDPDGNITPKLKPDSHPDTNEIWLIPIP